MKEIKVNFGNIEDAPSSLIAGRILSLRAQIKKICKCGNSRFCSTPKQIWQYSVGRQEKIADVEAQIFELEQILKERAYISKKQHQHKRRELGYDSPFNKPFRGSEEHHLNKQTVINVPSKLHKSVPHSLKDSESMQIINKMVLEWFITKDKRKSSKSIVGDTLQKSIAVGIVITPGYNQ